MAVTNMDNIIDSRDVIARIEELEAEQEALMGDWNGASELDKPAEFHAWEKEHGEELDSLCELAAEASKYSEGWEYGEILIRDSYFVTYAQELAEDIGAVRPNAVWPNNCIDWERAAWELRMDYTAVDFDGVTYWIR